MCLPQTALLARWHHLTSRLLAGWNPSTAHPSTSLSNIDRATCQRLSRIPGKRSCAMNDVFVQNCARSAHSLWHPSKRYDHAHRKVSRLAHRNSPVKLYGGTSTYYPTRSLCLCHLPVPVTGAVLSCTLNREITPSYAPAQLLRSAQ